MKICFPRAPSTRPRLFLLALCLFLPLMTREGRTAERERPFTPWKTRKGYIDQSYASGPDSHEREREARYRRLASHDKAAHWKAVFIRRSRDYTTPAILVDDGRLFLVQNDGTLTIIETATGTVLKRIRALQRTGADMMQKRRLNSRKLEVMNNVVIGKSYSVDFLMDRNTGEFLLSDYVYSVRTIGKYLLLDKGFRGVEVVDTVTLEVVSISDGSDTADVFPISGNGTVCVIGKESIECKDPGTGDAIWRVEKAEGSEERWLGGIFDGERIYVFAGNWKDRKQTCERILVFTPEGEELESIEPAPELFGGSYPEYFSGYVTFRGVKFFKNLPDVDRKRTEEKVCPKPTVRAMLGDDFVDGWYDWEKSFECFPDGSVLGIATTQSPINGKAEYVVRYGDAERQWLVKSHCLDDLAEFEGLEHLPIGPLGFFSFAGDDKHVFYASISGKVECLRRDNGQSVWVYSFPIAPWRIDPEFDNYLSPLFHGMEWATNFYVDDVRHFYDGEKSIGGAAPVDSDTAGPTRVVLDPEPFFIHVEPGHSVGRLLYGVPSFAISLLIASFVIQYARYRGAGRVLRIIRVPETYYTIILSTLLALGAEFLIYGLFGRYAREPAIFVLTMMLITLAASGYFARWVRNENRSGNRSETEPGDAV